MKKSSFIALILGVIGILFLGIGMCMCLLPEWQLFKQGIVVGIIGLIILLITVVVYRKIEHKASIKVTQKNILSVSFGIIGALTLGVGMCLSMVYEYFTLGIPIGIIGIILLLCLIPLFKELK